MDAVALLLEVDIGAMRWGRVVRRRTTSEREGAAGVRNDLGKSRYKKEVGRPGTSTATKVLVRESCSKAIHRVT